MQSDFAGVTAAGFFSMFRDAQHGCLCPACVKRRGGGQHNNGPCALDRFIRDMVNEITDLWAERDALRARLASLESRSGEQKEKERVK